LPGDGATSAHIDLHKKPTAEQNEDALIDVEPSEYSRILRKVDYRVIPILATLYLLSFLDRGETHSVFMANWTCVDLLGYVGSIGNAKIQGMATDLGLVGNQYNWQVHMGAIAYAADFFLQIQAQHVASFYNGCMGNCDDLDWNRPELLWSIGGQVLSWWVQLAWLAEAGLFPGLAFYISLWYPRANAQFRLALIFASASMAGAFSGLLAYLISMMDGVGGLEGWRWIFILEGILTVIVAAASYFFVWDEPATATFLTEAEKRVILDALNCPQTETSPNAQLGSEQSFKWKHVTDAVFDWQVCSPFPKLNRIHFSYMEIFKTWFHCIGYWGVAVAVYALSLFLPTIISGLGYSAAIAQLLTIPIYAAATISCILVGYFADKTGQRSFFAFGCYAAIVVGYLIAVVPPTFLPGLTYAGCFIAACGIYPAIPGLLALSSNNWAPNAKRAVGMAIQMGFGTMGGAAASNFYRSTDAPRYRLGHTLVLVFAGLGLVTMVAYYLICRRVNAKREAGADGVYQYTSDQLVDMGDKAPSFRYKL
ncbi:hypothetical protein N7466_005938, partial [Penicillium verhagenii]|uniref:uncharacterized protein n=1 Tax=Penicillium verhagenii TaxID=1562060 RepID=UPI0025458D34